MRRHKFIVTVAVMTVLLGGAMALKPEFLWLIFYGGRAQAYAESLLAGEKPATPGWATDIVIVKEEGFVTFNRYDSEVIYAFSRKGKPKSMNIVWSHAWSGWYIGGFGT